MSQIRIATLLLFSASTVWASASIREPLPIDVALSLRGHDSRSTFAFSPNGRWIAHTVQTDDILTADSRFFTSTGVPLAELRFRREAHITDTRSGEEVRLGTAASSSWAPAWSPDGTRVAFYADEGGTAGLWIWDVSTRRATRFASLTVRPFFGFEVPRWGSDSHTLLCKVLPEGMTIAQVNAMNPLPQTQRRFPPHDENGAGVLVLRATKDDTQSTNRVTPSFVSRSIADLVLVDLRSRQIQRIAYNSKLLWYGFSPDQRYVAYTQIANADPNGDDIRYDINVLDRRSGQSRQLARQVPMNYGIEVNWSPDSHSLAFIDHDWQGKAALALLPVDGSPCRHLYQSSASSLYEAAPHWSADSRAIFATVGGGRMWKINALSGDATEIGAPPGVEIAALVTQFDRPAAWTTDHGRKLWAVGFRRNTHQYSILCINAASGRMESEVALGGGAEDGFEIAASDTGMSVDATDVDHRIAFVASSQHDPADIWIFGADDRMSHQISHLNPGLGRYELGDAKLISFHTAEGKELRASLLLPPGHQTGQRLPTVVWVYGGDNGSDSVRTFGLVDKPEFNMHVLATRGYAVLFPDAPASDGAPFKGLLQTVMPAVDAAIAQGYADPERLAVMGNSYGAYSVLGLISQTDRFKAAVVSASAIHPDLLAGYLEMDGDGTPSWIGYMEHGQGGMGGSPWEYRSRYIDNSPIYNFNKITTPLLMAQGAEDGHLLGSDATFVALRRLGKDVEYRIYEGEGHTLQGRPSVRDFWLRRLAFLKAHLADSGSRAENLSP